MSLFDPQIAAYIPWVSGLSAVVCGLLCLYPQFAKLAAGVCASAVGVGFVIALGIWGNVTHAGAAVNPEPLMRWIEVAGLEANYGVYLDGLTMIMLSVVTGIGMLVVIYAAGYMRGDPGYARFFAAVSIFIFAMTTVVMADNLVLLFLGWEGVGLASYLLIGHEYHRPAAVNAAKKAFIVNRIGDFGVLLGMFCIFDVFGTVRFEGFLPAASALLTGDVSGLVGEGLAAYEQATAVLAGGGEWLLLAAPFGLMVGAFGKSAQLPLFVWLPDAMEGPTPVSALIHAATMVTSGVYVIARTMPLFELSPYALPTVAVIAGATAILGASIALAQYDLKRVFAYSTVSQLGYMFMGVAALSSTAGVFHLVSHAFFKALLFLTAGSVMHALAGQLDIRKISGLRHKMPVTFVLMGIGCAALAGLPVLTAGFWSKDLVLATTFDRAIATEGGTAFIYLMVGIVGVVTAFVTGYYCFRVWFRVFFGEERYAMGDHPTHHDGHEGDHGHDDEHGHHANEPHEMDWGMNGPLVVLAIGSVFAGLLLGPTHAVEHLIDGTSAEANALRVGDDATKYEKWVHNLMYGVSAVVAFASLALAFVLHGPWRKVEGDDPVRLRAPKVFGALNSKLWIDEVYGAVVVYPVRVMGSVFYVVDAVIVDTVVRGLGVVPRLLGEGARPAQSGRLHGYGLGMALGVAAVVAATFYAMNRG
ncbi:MAG: NADH-quinone oxidoreductase subunit L [Planctomycetota bacterium]